MEQPGLVSHVDAYRNQAIDEIERNNQTAREAATDFRQSFASRAAGWKRFSHAKHEYPFAGMVPCRAGDIEFTLFSANDDQVAWEYFWFGDDGYEPAIIRTWIQWCRRFPGRIIDIGGYTGVMSIIAARASPKNRVDLFEPVGRTIERAKINVRLNRVENRVVLHNYAASDRPASRAINLYRDENFVGTGNSIDPKDGKTAIATQRIECVTVGELLPDVSPTVVKVDVEGHEVEALRGMNELIRRGRPRMIIESWPDRRHELMGELAAHGYEVQPFEQQTEGVINLRCEPAGG